MIIKINNETLEGLIQDKTPILLDFWAPWCQPCRSIEPILDKLNHTFDSKIIIAKVNIDMQIEITKKYNVRSIPTLLLLKDGQEMLRLIATECTEKFIFSQINTHL